MILTFTKMQALGNDFVIFDGVRQQVTLTAEQCRRMADRHFGIGCDQILVVKPSRTEGVDFGYRIFNADGGEVEQCGNGARCFARFVVEKGLTDKDEISIETGSGIIRPRIAVDGSVTVDMGRPRFEPLEIPFLADSRLDRYDLKVGGETVVVHVVSMGNPHAVQVVDDIERAPVATLGRAIESHPRFPARVNAGFMQIIDPGHVKVRVYERGTGETLACGTGACAAVVAGRLGGWLHQSVEVQLPGGILRVNWEGEDRPVYMTGPAVTVFDGSIDLDTL